MQPLILLHGAIGSSAQLGKLSRELSRSFRVYVPDLAGHGSREMPIEPFSIRLFADDILRFMEREQIAQAPVFGYSMGGYVGIYLARHYPEKISKVITLATKYQWSEEIAAKEIKMLDPDKIEQKLPAFAEVLRERHLPNDWKEVLYKTAEMMTGLGRDNALKEHDYATVACRVLLLLGDRDKMVSLEETIAVYRALPDGQMGMLPHTPHPLEQVNTAMLAFHIEQLIGV